MWELRISAIILLMIISIVDPATAQDDSNIVINGYGGWAFKQSDNDNMYQGATPGGTTSLYEFAIGIQADM